MCSAESKQGELALMRYNHGRCPEFRVNQRNIHLCTGEGRHLGQWVTREQASIPEKERQFWEPTTTSIFLVLVPLSDNQKPRKAQGVCTSTLSPHHIFATSYIFSAAQVSQSWFTCLPDIPIPATDFMAGWQGGNCSRQREDKDIALPDSFVC